MLEKYKDVLTIRDFIEATGIGRDNAYALVRSKQLPSIRIGRRIYISKEAVIRFINGQTDKPE